MSYQSDYTKLGLKEMLRAIEQGCVKVEDLIESCMDRIDERENQIGAWQYRLSKTSVINQYQSNIEFYKKSILRGLPIGIKDIIDTVDMPTEMGSIIHKGRRPSNDASCVSLLKSTGAIVVGKTVTTEFAYFKPGKTANPCDIRRTPGGSSSGSAASVSDYMVPIALGSQTAASVIRPAAYCGVVGYVGTRGTFSLRGIQPLGQSLDSLGILSRKVEDVDFVRSLLLCEKPSTEKLNGLKPKKILLIKGSCIGDVDPDMAEGLKNVAELLRDQGVIVDVLAIDNWPQRLVECHGLIMAYEAARNLAYESLYADKMSVPLQELIEQGLEISYELYVKIIDEVSSIDCFIKDEYYTYDAFLAPAAPGAAPLGLERTGAPHMSRPWQVLGLPTVTVPGIKNVEGLPLGIQLIGKKSADKKLLRMAIWLEGQLR